MSEIIGLGRLLRAEEYQEEKIQTEKKKVCNEPLRVLSMILKFEMLFRKSEARGA